MRERCVERKPAAQREADERRAVDVQRVEQPDEIVDRRELRAGRLGAAPEPQVVTDRAEPAGERPRLRLPKSGIAEAAVHEDDCRTAALVLDP